MERKSFLAVYLLCRGYKAECLTPHGTAKHGEEIPVLKEDGDGVEGTWSVSFTNLRWGGSYMGDM